MQKLYLQRRSEYILYSQLTAYYIKVIYVVVKGVTVGEKGWLMLLANSYCVKFFYRDVELNLSLRCDISSSCHAVNVSISLPLPKSTTG